LNKFIDLVIWAIILFVIGYIHFLVTTQVVEVYKVREKLDWIDGVVVELGVDKSTIVVDDVFVGPSVSDVFRPYVKYEYIVEGVAYTSNRITVYERNYVDYLEANRQIESLKKGERIRVWYDSNDPGVSIVNTDISTIHIISLAVLTVLLIVVFYLMLKQIFEAVE